jgi:hypothetical protein
MVIVFTSISLASTSKLNSDDKFLKEVRKINHSLIEDKSDSELIDMAHQTCIFLNSGVSAKDIIFEISGAKGFLQEALVIYGAIIVKYSIEVFCPEYSEQIKDWVY